MATIILQSDVLRLGQCAWCSRRSDFEYVACIRIKSQEEVECIRFLWLVNLLVYLIAQIRKSARLGSNAWFVGGCESQILNTEELGYWYGHAEK